MQKTFLALLLVLACALQAAGFQPQPSHGGTLIEIGDEAGYVELVMDKDAGKLRAYVMDGEAEDPVRVSQKTMIFNLRAGTRKLHLVLKAVSDPLSGEKAGDSSEFEADLALLQGLEHFEGVLQKISLFGQDFSRVALSVPGAPAK
jgi:hypothetical protein